MGACASSTTSAPPPIFHSINSATTTSASITTPVIISLDGNIGSGKSSLLAALEKSAPEFTVLPEPVADWLSIKNDSGESLLSLFYKDASRWSFTFQQAAFLTRLVGTTSAVEAYKPQPGKAPVIISERSVLTDRHIFAETMRQEGKMDSLEWALYMKWFNAFAQRAPVRGIVYLATSPALSQERILKRGRDGEGSISLAYLETLDRQHQKWLRETPLPTISLPAEAPLEESVERIRVFCKQFYE